MAEVILKNIKKVYPYVDRKEKQEMAGKSNLKVTDEGVLAVQDFDLTIADKEFIVLVGPSGCGKSTTLNMIAGLEDITSGDLFIDGKRMNDIEPQDRDIAMVFQSYALYPHMSVYDNMSFALKLKHMPKAEIDRKVKEAAEILNISEYLKRKPKALSGGQRQRVAIGRAIVRNPKVFLMDEPLSNLDAKLRNQMRAEIIKLRERINTTFIYVTHDQTEAMTLGDRIVIMKDGVVQQIGTPQAVYGKPANLFVASFIGTPQAMLPNCLGMMIDSFMIWLTAYAGTIIVSRSLDTYHLGVYRTGYTTITAYLGIIFTITQPVLFSALSRCQNDKNECDKIYAKYLKYVACLILPLGAGICVYHSLAINILLGNQWSDASIIVACTGISYPIAMLTGQFNSVYFRSQGRPFVAMTVQALYTGCMIMGMMLSVKESFEAFSEVLYRQFSMAMLKLRVGKALKVLS